MPTLCDACKHDRNITMFFLDVKAKYKLTNKNLDNSELYNVTIKVGGRYEATLYIIDEIEEYMSTLELTTAQTKAYDKRKLITDKIRKDKGKYEQTKQQVVNNLKMLLTKHNIKIYKKHTDDDIMILIHKYYEPTAHVGHLVTAIIEQIENDLKLYQSRSSRRRELVKQIKKNIDKKYRAYARTHKFYKMYVDGERDNLNSTLKSLIKYVDKEKNRDNNIITIKNPRKKILKIGRIGLSTDSPFRTLVGIYNNKYNDVCIDDLITPEFKDAMMQLLRIQTDDDIINHILNLNDSIRARYDNIFRIMSDYKLDSIDKKLYDCRKYIRNEISYKKLSGLLRRQFY